MTPRGRLIDFLQRACPSGNPWAEGTPLVGSDSVDSLLLLQLAVWVEGETGQRLDPASIDVAGEWSTVGGLLSFLERRAAGTAR